MKAFPKNPNAMHIGVAPSPTGAAYVNLYPMMMSRSSSKKQRLMLVNGGGHFKNAWAPWKSEEFLIVSV